MPSKDYLMLRSAQRARHEARTASLQLIFWCVNQFPDSPPSPRRQERTAADDQLTT